MATLTVGTGFFSTIQAAIAASHSGDTIQVAAGTYAGFTASVAGVSIVAVGEVTIAGSMLSVIGALHLDDYFQQNHPSYSGTNGITVSASNVSISGFTITGFATGINVGTSDGDVLTNNILTDNVIGLVKSTAAVVTNLTVNDNTFTHGIQGMTIQAAADDAGAFDHVTMNDNHFSHLSEKGMYFEQLSNASLDGNSFDDVGNYGRVAPPFDVPANDGQFGQAIDINLKYETYFNVTFTDTVITNSGHSDRDGAGSPSTFGAAIGVKIRDDGPSYNSNPADFDGQIVFNGLTIDGTSTGVRMGEPGKNNDGPDVLLENVSITNATVTDFANVTDPVNGGTATVELAPGQIVFDAHTSQADLDVTGNASPTPSPPVRATTLSPAAAGTTPSSAAAAAISRFSPGRTPPTTLRPFRPREAFYRARFREPTAATPCPGSRCFSSPTASTSSPACRSRPPSTPPTTATPSSLPPGPSSEQLTIDGKQSRCQARDRGRPPSSPRMRRT